MSTQPVAHIISNHKTHSAHTFIEIMHEKVMGERTWHSEQSFVVSNRPILNLTGLLQTDIVRGGNPCAVFIDYVTKSAVHNRLWDVLLFCFYSSYMLYVLQLWALFCPRGHITTGNFIIYFLYFLNAFYI